MVADEAQEIITNSVHEIVQLVDVVQDYVERIQRLRALVGILKDLFPAVELPDIPAKSADLAGLGGPAGGTPNPPSPSWPGWRNWQTQGAITTQRFSRLRVRAPLRALLIQPRCLSSWSAAAGPNKGTCIWGRPSAADPGCAVPT